MVIAQAKLSMPLKKLQPSIFLQALATNLEVCQERSHQRAICDPFAISYVSSVIFGRCEYLCKSVAHNMLHNPIPTSRYFLP